MVTTRAGLVWAVALAASLAVNGHTCKRLGEIEERERGKDGTIAELRKEPEWLGKIMAGFEDERRGIEDIRKAARQGVRDEMRANPVFRAWADGKLPSSVAAGVAAGAAAGAAADGRLLGKTRARSHKTHAAAGADNGGGASGLDRENQRGPSGVRAGS